MGVNSLRSWEFLDALAPRRDCSRGKRGLYQMGSLASKAIVQHEVLNFQSALLA